MTNQVSHPYKTGGLTFTLLGRRPEDKI